MSDSDSLIGQTLSHYHILEKIGAGGMGVVYRAHDNQLKRDAALKVLPAGTLNDEAARKLFRREALALAKLNHPNIETVFEFNSQEGVDFLVMELIPGYSLSGKIKQGPLTQQEIVRLGTQLAEGLAAAHAEGVIHRDLKPANLFVTPDGRLKILDFGLAKLLHPEHEDDVTRTATMETETVSGTVPYMSPEQLRGLPVDARSDLYAAGAVLYEMATGQRPFPQTRGAQLIGAILHQPPSPPRALNAQVSARLESIILKSLEKDPSQRYQSSGELRVALEGLASATASPSTPSLRANASRSRRYPMIAAVTALLILGGLLGIYALRHNSPKIDLSGEWKIENTIQSTSFHPFQGLRLGYRVFLSQRGTDLTGTGEKWSEDDKWLPPKAHTPIQVSASISGNKIFATFQETGAQRTTTGTFDWTYQPETNSLSGTFSSTAADTRGSSVGVRVVH
jgi:serine/threonine protein kinase